MDLDEDEDEVSYRCVTPGDLITSLRAADEVLSKGHFFWKKIQKGMDEKFYIKILGNDSNDGEDSDDGDDSFKRVDWSSMINCG